MPPTRRSPETIRARTSTELIRYAESLGLTVCWALELPERGRWVDGVGVILLRYGMTERRTVSTLAHELAHHHYGDICGSDRESRAWRWAARLLIPPGDYARAEGIHHSPGAIALELGVTVDVVKAYQAAA